MSKEKGLFEKLNKKTKHEIEGKQQEIFKNNSLGVCRSKDSPKKHKMGHSSSEENNCENIWDNMRLKTIAKKRYERIFELEALVLGYQNKIKKISHQLNENPVEDQQEERKIIEVKLSESDDLVYKETDKLNDENRELRKKLFKLNEEYQNSVANLKIELDKSRQTVNVDANDPLELKTAENFEIYQKSEEHQNEVEKLLLRISDVEKDAQILGQDKLILLEKNKSLERNLAICEKRLNVSLSIDEEEGHKIIIEELKNVSEAFEEILTENKSIQKLISEMRSKNRSLEHEVIGLKNKLKNRMRLDELLDLNKKKIVVIKGEIENEINTFDAKYSEAKKVEDKMLTQIEHYKKLYQSARIEVHSLESKVNKISNAGLSNIETLFDIRSKNLLCSKQCKILEEKVKAYEKVFDNGMNVSGLIEMTDYYKQELYCSLCKINKKSHAIVKCMHVFCEDCLHERLRVRVRTCPKCNAVYSNEDIKKIYL